MINNNYEYEFEGDEEDLDEEDLIIVAAAVTAAIAAGLVAIAAMTHAQKRYSMRLTSVQPINLMQLLQRCAMRRHGKGVNGEVTIFYDEFYPWH